MSLNYLTDKFLSTLRLAIPANMARYQEKAPWIGQFAQGRLYCSEANVQVGRLRALVLPQGSELYDLENCRIIYSDLMALTPVLASDERLWAWLTHAYHWEYMICRWPASTEGVIRSRYFFKNAGTSGLVLNGISRLWWFGYLTYQPDAEDQYELTKVLLSNQDIHTGLLQRNYGRSKSIVAAILVYFRDNYSELERLAIGKGGIGKLLQQLTKDLNTAGGVQVLDALKREELIAIIKLSVSKFSEGN